jgi:hypothetical protein
MPRFRKKPVVIDAFKVPEIDDIDGRLEFEEWAKKMGAKPGELVWKGSIGLYVKTLEDGEDGKVKHFGQVGDYIIKGVQGEFYPCKPDIFSATYEEVK